MKGNEIMQTKKENSGAKKRPTRIQISLVAATSLLLILLFGVFSKVPLVKFLSAFWMTIIAAGWVSLLLPRKSKS